MADRRLRVVIDPNLLASALLGGTIRAQFLTITDVADRLDICYSDALINEVERLPKHSFFAQKGIDDSVTAAFLGWFSGLALKVIATSQVRIGRDANDFYLLSLCRDARADFLLTGDPDLLILQKYGQTKILHIRDFIPLLPSLM